MNKNVKILVSDNTRWQLRTNAAKKKISMKAYIETLVSQDSKDLEANG